MKKNFQKKLASYSALASASLLAANSSNAQIIYTNPPDIHLIGVGAHHALDLNNDGVFDVNVNISDYSTLTPGGVVNIDNFPNVGYPVAGVMYTDCHPDFSYGYGLLPFKSGKAITQELNQSYPYLWWYPISGGDILNWDYYGQTCHRWAGLKKHFVAFRIRSNSGDLNYGWIRLSVNKSGYKVIIYDWAVNAVPDQPIFAGQTMKLVDEDLQSSSNLKIYSYGKQIFINQNSQNLTLEISIYNLLGEEVKHVISTDENLNIQADQFPSGIYIVKARSNSENISKEVVIE